LFGMRKLYDWVLSWANTPYGGLALFVLAFAESSFFPVPPDVLLIALALSIPARAFRFAAIAAAGSVLGGLFGYLLGFGVWHALDDIFYAYVPGFTPEGFQQVQNLFEQYDFWVVFSAGFHARSLQDSLRSVQVFFISMCRSLCSLPRSVAVCAFFWSHGLFIASVPPYAS
jgi:membrane protein YqaA with SNARE-associated domain